MPYFPPAGGGGGQTLYDIVVEPGDDLSAILPSAPNGSSIFIKSGNYTLTSDCILTGTQVTVIGESSAWSSYVDINMAGFAFGNDVAANNNYSNLRLALNAGVVHSAGYTTWDNCYFDVGTPNPLFGTVGWFVTVKNCQIVFSYGAGLISQSYVDFSGVQYTTFENNFISTNLDNYDGATAYPSFILGTNSKFLNNTIDITTVYTTNSVFMKTAGDNIIVSENIYNDLNNTSTYAWFTEIGGYFNKFTNNSVTAQSSCVLVNATAWGQVINDNSFYSQYPNSSYASLEIRYFENAVISGNAFQGNTNGNTGILFNTNQALEGVISSNSFENYDVGIDFSNEGAGGNNGGVSLVANTFSYTNTNITSLDGYGITSTANSGVKIQEDRIYYRALNNSGSQIDEGSPVFAFYNAGQIQIENGPYANFPNWLGVATENINNGSTGWIQVSGEGKVAILDNLAVTESERLSPSSNLVLSNYVFDNTVQNLQFARAMETYAGGGGGSAVYLLKAQIYPQYSLTTENFQTVYDAIVAPSGGDYTTLSAAVAAASNGWNILVRPGTYTETTINTSLTELNIVGAGVGNTVLNFGSNQFFNSSGDNFNLSNLSMNYDGGYFYVAAQTPIVTNVEVTDIAAPFAGSHMEFASTKGIFNNLVYNNNTVGSYSAVRVTVSGNDNKFNDCTFNVSLDGLIFGFARAIDTTNTDYTQFYNCTFNSSNGPGTGASVLLHNNTDALIVDGCIFNNATATDDYAIYDNNAVGSKITNSVFNNFGFAIYVSSSTGDTLIDSNQINSPTTTGIGIDVDYTIGTIVTSNKITLGAGTTTGIRMLNTGEKHTVTANIIEADTGINVDTGCLDITLSSNVITASTDILDNGTNTTIIPSGPPGQTLYDAIVAPSGGDYTTLGAALAAASNGDTIFVRSGTYNEAAITNSLNNITIIGESKEATIINVPASANIQFNGTGVTVTNLRVQVNNAANSNFNLNGANAVAYGCHFSTTRNSGTTFSFSGGEIIVANNTFTTTNSHQFGDFILLGYGAIFTGNYLNLDDGNENSNSGMVVASSGGNVTISNNIFDVYQETANVQDCPYIYLNSSNCVVSNNKIWYRQSGGRGVGVKANNSDGHTITGNNFNNVFKGVQLRVGNTLVASNTITLSQASTNVAIGIHQSQANQQYNIFNDNLIYGGSTYFKGIDVANGSEDFQISNNTIRWCEDGAIILGTTKRAKVTDNIIWQTSTVTLDKYLNDGGTATHARGNGVPTTEEKNQVTMKNVSGGALAAGDLVILNNVASGTEITTTTTAGDSKVFGVASESIANNEFGKIQTLGKVTTLQADGTAAIVIGDFLTAYTTAKTAALATAGDTAIAIALEALPSGTGQLDALIINPRLI